jgi:hypothetical protein
VSRRKRRLALAARLDQAGLKRPALSSSIDSRADPPAREIPVPCPGCDQAHRSAVPDLSCSRTRPMRGIGPSILATLRSSILPTLRNARDPREPGSRGFLVPPDVGVPGRAVSRVTCDDFADRWKRSPSERRRSGARRELAAPMTGADRALEALDRPPHLPLDSDLGVEAALSASSPDAPRPWGRDRPPRLPVRTSGACCARSGRPPRRPPPSRLRRRWEWLPGAARRRLGPLHGLGGLGGRGAIAERPVPITRAPTCPPFRLDQGDRHHLGLLASRVNLPLPDVRPPPRAARERAAAHPPPRVREEH